jgi:hypothetical protein
MADGRVSCDRTATQPAKISQKVPQYLSPHSSSCAALRLDASRFQPIPSDDMVGIAGQWTQAGHLVPVFLKEIFDDHRPKMRRKRQMCLAQNVILSSKAPLARLSLRHLC